MQKTYVFMLTTFGLWFNFSVQASLVDTLTSAAQTAKSKIGEYVGAEDIEELEDSLKANIDKKSDESKALAQSLFEEKKLQIQQQINKIHSNVDTLRHKYGLEASDNLQEYSNKLILDYLKQLEVEGKIAPFVQQLLYYQGVIELLDKANIQLQEKYADTVSFAQERVSELTSAIANARRPIATDIETDRTLIREEESNLLAKAPKVKKSVRSNVTTFMAPSSAQVIRVAPFSAEPVRSVTRFMPAKPKTPPPPPPVKRSSAPSSLSNIDITNQEALLNELFAPSDYDDPLMNELYTRPIVVPQTAPVVPATRSLPVPVRPSQPRALPPTPERVNRSMEASG